MTLILTALTRQTIVQVADMRLTNTRTGRVVDDSSAKMVVYGGRFLFSYTGPACMGSEPTARWLATVLAGVTDPGNLLETLAKEAQKVIKTYPPAQRHLAIVGAGWLDSGNGVSPAYLQVANYDFATRALFPEMRPSSGGLQPTERVRLHVAGADLPADLRDEAMDHLQRRSGRRREQPANLVAILGPLARRVALTNRTVGRRVLIGAIPATSGVDLPQPLYRYWGDGAEPQPVLYVPEFASTDMATGSRVMAFGGGSARTAPDPCA